MKVNPLYGPGQEQKFQEAALAEENETDIQDE